MSSEGFHHCTLGDALTLQRGFDLPVDQRKPGRVPVIASTGPVGVHNESPLDGPGVVIGRSGSLGGGQFIEGPYWPLNTTLWVKDFKGNCPRYCCYLLKSIDFKQFNVGSGVPTLNRNHVHPLPITLPRLDIQEEIARILGSLDDRIDNLRATNATLEAIAQAIFKSWFIDFDPVRAKMGGRKPEGMDAETAALFPSEFEESELGLIPRGWREGRLFDLVELKYGKSLRASDRHSGQVPVYGSGGITGWHDEALVNHPTVIVGRKGSVGTLYWEDRPSFPIDTTFFVSPKAVPLTFSYYTMIGLGLDQLNTDAAVPGLNRDNAYRQLVIIPPSDVLGAWGAMTSVLREKIRLLDDEMGVLNELRDTLLPRLISGNIRIGASYGATEAAQC